MTIPAVGGGCAGPSGQLPFVTIRVAVAALAKRQPLVLRRPRTERAVATLARDVAVTAAQRIPGGIVEGVAHLVRRVDDVPAVFVMAVGAVVTEGAAVGIAVAACA